MYKLDMLSAENRGSGIKPNTVILAVAVLLLTYIWEIGKVQHRTKYWKKNVLI